MSFVIAPTPHIAVPIADSHDHFPVRRVYCVGRNYAEHAREMGANPEREPPFFFCKPADSIVPVPEGTSLAWPYPLASRNVHYEIELVIAIGRGGTHISVKQAPEHIWGATRLGLI